MKIQVKHILPNPYRNLRKYPIDRQKVNSLKESIAKTRFWENLLVRPSPTKKDYYEIAYGHHRLEALKELDIKSIDNIPVHDIPDAEMVVIMANENLEDWQLRPSILMETVLVAKQFLDAEIRKYATLKEFRDRAAIFSSPLITDEGNFTQLKSEGVGRDILHAFLGANFKRWQIEEALRTIKNVQSKTISQKAVEAAPSLKVHQAASTAFQKYNVPTSQQEKIVKRIAKEEVGKRDVDREIKQEAIKRGYHKEKRERPQPKPLPDLEEITGSLIAEMQEMTTTLRKIGPYMQHHDRGHILNAFYRALEQLAKVIDGFPEKPSTTLQSANVTPKQLHA